MVCRTCELRIDPVAAPTHPSCDDTPDAIAVRRAHARWMGNLTAHSSQLTYAGGRLVGASTWPRTPSR